MQGWSKLLMDFGQNVLGPIMVGLIAYFSLLWKERRNKQKYKRSVYLSTEKNEEIQDLLIEIRLRLQADRAYVCMFHNGDKFMADSPLIKVSRTNESVSPGISLEAQHYQNILTSLLTDETRLLKEDTPSFVKVADLKDSKFKRMSNARNIKCLARCPIKRGDDMIAYIGLDYNNEIERPTNLDELQIFAGRIEQILSSLQ